MAVVVVVVVVVVVPAVVIFSRAAPNEMGWSERAAMPRLDSNIDCRPPPRVVLDAIHECAVAIAVFVIAEELLPQLSPPLLLLVGDGVRVASSSAVALCVAGRGGVVEAAAAVASVAITPVIRWMVDLFLIFASGGACCIGGCSCSCGCSCGSSCSPPTELDSDVDSGDAAYGVVDADDMNDCP
jgi:hypothetical protein